MALTAQQILDLRDDLGIGASGADDEIFTDAELNRLYERAGSDYDTTIVLALRQLLVKLAGETDYWAGETREQRSQRFKQVKELLSYYDDKVVAGATQAIIVGARAVPPRDKDVPRS